MKGQSPRYWFVAKIFIMTYTQSANFGGNRFRQAPPPKTKKTKTTTNKQTKNDTCTCCTRLNGS